MIVVIVLYVTKEHVNCVAQKSFERRLLLYITPYSSYESNHFLGFILIPHGWNVVRDR